MPATSGSCRPSNFGLRREGKAEEAGAGSEGCQSGRFTRSLIPPPEALLFLTFQTTSSPSARRLLPPQARTRGLEAGKVTRQFPSPSIAQPSSPEAAQIVIPRLAASSNSCVMTFIVFLPHQSSNAPQLIESMDGLFSSSWIALESAPTQPFSSFVAK